MAHHNKAVPMAEKPNQFNVLALVVEVLAKTLVLLSVSAPVFAEIYIYLGPDGERMVSDRPVAGYSLLAKRDTFTDAGHILADRPLSTGGPVDFQAHIRKASEKYMVDPALIEAIIHVESSFDPQAVSTSGATGLMQLMPGTARDLEVSDRYSPRQNIHGGTRYISELMTRFDNDLQLVVAAYNAGPSAVELHAGIPPKQETQRYVQKVMAAYRNFRMIRYGSPK